MIPRIRTICLYALVLPMLYCTSLWAAPTIKADLNGAGATFPAPLYQHWIKQFAATSPGFTISYAEVGSGEGIKRFLAETVDFGASDTAMNDTEAAQARHGVQFIPATAGIVVLAYNLPNVDKPLRLSRKVYVDIFLGNIRKWDDARIAALNPEIKLPDLNITTVVRADSSGTTWTFTNHLQAISPRWKDAGFMAAKKIDWPGNSMSVNYNEGVANRILHSWGAIGYVEYGVASRAGLPMAILENKDGHYVPPSVESGMAALANNAPQLPTNLRLFIPDPAGAGAYPISSYSWLLLHQRYPNPQQGERIKKFVDWCLKEGQKYAVQLGYTPLPQAVSAKAVQALDQVR
ncbi:MAG: phosphate ABC transporter substrate-binding protein PstS [Desulfobulbaceae bacterium]|nr:phosphate ABC transporter substrate-binding protein PstS [Desulfobulbaceae bacterium]